ncbi:regulator of protease activity HflC (stomatin/prohibitin superfamily) [Nocardia transvalensis]|uniref:Regulator of protease activity HflC (Stomatin/prohibitin superfamily) n=1 Tax=Nocardia transvalensis TaxID=37333 RepID=A0A7W9P9I9_9NOCA|nr:slipin family protein [Nocardia transvalensis]MBB5912026.1 regulator of protease activity HflC (stomatin/prohibitin superfamily) [Nocardia transvalensis]
MFTTVMEWQRTLLYRDGTLEKVLEPGRHRYDQRRCALVTVDMRPRQTQVTGQELLTRDGLSLRASFTVAWVVTDPVEFTVGAQYPESVLYAAVQEAARDKVAAHTLDELVADRALLAGAEEVAAAATGIGIRVSSLRARDLMLPGELRKAALETVLAKERGRADLERARAEAAALRSLANTARLLDENPALLRLRTLQVAATPGTQVVLDPRDRA